jgi:3,5-epimerase/4-reductase
MTVVIFGARGYMGNHFLRLFPEAITPNADIAVRHEVALYLDEHPDLVVNCAGKTGHPNVDWCEEHKMETLSANVTGPLVLAEECAKRHIFFVHLSTGCIYDGQGPYTEKDSPNFIGSFYSRTKATAETLLNELSEGEILQLRLRMPFEGTPHPRNLITKLTGYPKINALPNSLTYIPDFMKAAKELIEKRATGTYNVVNPGAISPYGIMKIYKEIVDPSAAFEAFIPQKNPQAKNGERSDCILGTAKLEAEGIVLQPIEEAVREALTEYRKNSRLGAVP